MSFGWSVGDIFAAANLLWRVGKSLGDANGARKEYQGTASLLYPIQFQLRQLGHVIGECEKDDKLIGRGDNVSLDEDAMGFIGVVTQLRELVTQLEEGLEKGLRMRLGKEEHRKLRHWPMDQINKLRWTFVESGDIESLLQRIYRLTQGLPYLYRHIDSELAHMRFQAQGVYHEDQMAYMRQLANRIQTLQEILPSAVASHLLSMNNSQGNSILLIGPEEGVASSVSSTDSVPTILSIKGESSHLERVSYTSMSAAISTKVNNMRADFVLRNKFETWLSGVSSHCLWLSGKSARTISAVVYKVGIDRMRPIAAVACRHVDAEGVEIKSEERLYRMIYSVLFQLLHLIEDDAAVFEGPKERIGDLNTSITSMPVAMKMIENLLSLIPQCVVLVDGWHFVSDGNYDSTSSIQSYLRDFLGLFAREERDVNGGRLLLTTPGSSIMLRDLPREVVDSLQVTQHIDKGPNKLSTLLSGLEW